MDYKSAFSLQRAAVNTYPHRGHVVDRAHARYAAIHAHKPSRSATRRDISIDNGNNVVGSGKPVAPAPLRFRHQEHPFGTTLSTTTSILAILANVGPHTPPLTRHAEPPECCTVVDIGHILPASNVHQHACQDLSGGHAPVPPRSAPALRPNPIYPPHGLQLQIFPLAAPLCAGHIKLTKHVCAHDMCYLHAHVEWTLRTCGVG